MQRDGDATAKRTHCWRKCTNEAWQSSETRTTLKVRAPHVLNLARVYVFALVICAIQLKCITKDFDFC